MTGWIFHIPFLFSKVQSHPFSIRYCTISGDDVWTALMSGVAPLRDWELMSAPCLSSSWTKSSCPDRQAWWSGVHLKLSWTVISALCLEKWDQTDNPISTHICRQTEKLMSDLETIITQEHKSDKRSIIHFRHCSFDCKICLNEKICSYLGVWMWGSECVRKCEVAAKSHSTVLLKRTSLDFKYLPHECNVNISKRNCMVNINFWT